MSRWSAAVLILAACGGAHGRVRATTGAIAGIARDFDSGDPVSAASVRARVSGQFDPTTTTTSERGLYFFEHLPPGKYSVVGEFAGQPIEVDNVEVIAGETQYVDLMFTLGRADPLVADFHQLDTADIVRFHPSHLAAGTALIEGTVRDRTTNQRVAGAVVTAVDADKRTEQTATDDAGRFEFPALVPGTYVVSAYYSVSSRAQIEVRRSDITLAAGEGARVPLLIETAN